MIFSQSWMKKQGIIIDMTNDSLAFWPGYCIQIGATSFTTLSQLRLSTAIPVVRIEKDITSQKMIKKGSKKNMTDFLQTSNKLSSKKKRQINKGRWKMSIRDTSSRKVTISSLDSSDKKELLVPIPAIKKSDPKFKDIDIAMISANSYCAAGYLKNAQVCTISMKDIQYQVEKKAKA